jgi:hypothetical protein
MAPIEIHSGLRRLEFERSEQGAGESTHALVEFVRGTPLTAGQTVRVALGRRNEMLRELVGVPDLIETHSANGGTAQYLYRLRAAVTVARVRA